MSLNFSSVLMTVVVVFTAIQSELHFGVDAFTASSTASATMTTTSTTHPPTPGASQILGRKRNRLWGSLTVEPPSVSSSSTNSVSVQTRSSRTTTKTPIKVVTTVKDRKRKTRNDQSNYRPRISSIDSAQEFKDAVLDGDDRLVIVNYYASWCKTCQRFGRDFKAIGKQIGDLEGSDSDDDDVVVVRRGAVRMASVDFGKNTELCKSLGVSKFPYVQIYSRGRLVDAMSCGGPKKTALLLEKVGRYLSMSPAELEFEADMFEGTTVLGRTVLDAINQELEAPSPVATSAV